MIQKFKASSDCSICILDTTGHYVNHVREQLVKFKQRFNESLADRICVCTSLVEIPKGAIVIMADYFYQTLNHKGLYQCTTVSSISNLTHYDLRRATIKLNIHYTKSAEETKKLLQTLPNTFTYDCEATGLDVHLDTYTMFSFGLSETEAFVISAEDDTVPIVEEFLTTTDKTVIMHNASFDMKLIRYRTGKFIKNFEDSQLLAWTHLNHTNVQKAKVGLKPLAGHVYGAWSVAPDLFGIQHKYNPQLIEYSGTDACATWFVWNEFKDKE